jgi:tRNA (guanine-N7-)-methyltransferase
LITFPDTQTQISSEKKRLTSPKFLKKYLKFLKKGGVVHLKTDNRDFYDYTLEVAKENDYKVNVATADLYNSGITNEILDIKTTYEKIFLKQGFPICYLNFTI